MMPGQRSRCLNRRPMLPESALPRRRPIVSM